MLYSVVRTSILFDFLLLFKSRSGPCEAVCPGMILASFLLLVLRVFLLLSDCEFLLLLTLSCNLVLSVMTALIGFLLRQVLNLVMVSS